MDRNNTYIPGVTRSTIQIVAYVTMLIDHFFAILYVEYFSSPYYHYSYEFVDDDPIYAFGRNVGRIAFILFAFMLVEGMVHTRSRARYVWRMLLLALISEIPYDLADSGKIFDFSDQSVMLTLVLGACAIWIYDLYWDGKDSDFGLTTDSEDSHDGNVSRNSRLRNRIFAVAGILSCCVIAYISLCNYGFAGVLLILFLYIFRNNIYKCLGVFFAFCLAWGVNVFFAYKFSLYLSNGLITDLGSFFSHFFDIVLRNGVIAEFTGVLAFVLLFQYNGVPGIRLPKALTYLFYPVQFLIFWALKCLLF